MKSRDLVCPYSRCGHSFERPVLVTDCSRLPRETYYVCPHCLLRLELLMEGDVGEGRVVVKAMEDEGLLSLKGESGGEAVSSVVSNRPSKSCRHFLGYLRSLPASAGMPDECAICPMIMKCYIKKE